MTFKKHYTIELAPTLQGHFYRVMSGKKFLGYVPSSTTILNAYPASPHLQRWIADRGWHESQRIKSDAGERGTRVHQACEWLMAGQELFRDQYSLKEWNMISGFVNWYRDYNPVVLGVETALYSHKYKYAGRVDLICELNGMIYIVDLKTSDSLHNSFALQFASYAQALEELTDLKVYRTATLQLGKNKKGYRFKEYDDWKSDFKVFQSVRETWNYENPDLAKEPPVLDLPVTLKL